VSKHLPAARAQGETMKLPAAVLIGIMGCRSRPRRGERRHTTLTLRYVEKIRKPHDAKVKGERSTSPIRHIFGGAFGRNIAWFGRNIAWFGRNIPNYPG